MIDVKGPRATHFPPAIKGFKGDVFGIGWLAQSVQASPLVGSRSRAQPWTRPQHSGNRYTLSSKSKPASDILKIELCLVC